MKKYNIYSTHASYVGCVLTHVATCFCLLTNCNNHAFGGKVKTSGQNGYKINPP